MILLFQLQVMDRRRVLRVIGQLEEQYVMQFDSELRQMLKL